MIRNWAEKRMFTVGETQITLGGQLVMIESYSNEGTEYETVKGSDGKHRYNTRDYGRCTATDHECPVDDNLEIPADKRYLCTWIKEKRMLSMERAISCTCGSDFLRNMRDPFGDVIIRCLSCGNKSKPESGTHNAVNRWNKREFQ